MIFKKEREKVFSYSFFKQLKIDQMSIAKKTKKFCDKDCKIRNNLRKILHNVYYKVFVAKLLGLLLSTFNQFLKHMLVIFTKKHEI